MKRTLVYELKRNLLPLVIFCAVAAAVSVVYTSTTTLSYTNEFDGYYEYSPIDSCLGAFAAVLCVLAAIVPVLQFSYRMKQRSADLWYSLPVGRKKLTLVRVLGGLVLVFAPYTLAYWLGVACIALQDTQFLFVHYLSFYAVSLLLGVGLFGVNCFLFTRANTVEDGIVFLVLWACLLPLAVLVFLGSVRLITIDVPEGTPEYLAHYRGMDIAAYLFPYSPTAAMSGLFEALVFREEVSEALLLPVWFAIPVCLLEGVGAYVGLFVRADRDRAENAGQVSSSWLGYRVLIPVYIVLLLGTVGDLLDGEILMGVLVAVIGAALYFAYRRSFRVKKEDVICYAVSVALGIALALILHYCT